MTYMANDGRQLQKIGFSEMGGKLSNSGDYMYPCLKLHPDIISLDFSRCTLNLQDAKALGKVLADFKQIRELYLTGSGLTEPTTKEIADGLMRAKQLEVLIAD